MTARILALANQKGGVGKTTTAINLAAILAEQFRVLLVDMDPQGNASDGLALENDITNTVTELLQGECSFEEAVIPSPITNLDVLPSDIGLSILETDKAFYDLPVTVLREKLLDAPYDYIIIDCPPSMGRLTTHSLTAAERVLIPIRPGKFSLKGLQILFDLIENVRLRLNPKLRVLGLFYNEAQTRTNLYQGLDRVLRKSFENFLMETFIPKNVTIEEAQAFGKPVTVYDKKASGSEAFISLAKEVIDKWPRVARQS